MSAAPSTTSADRVVDTGMRLRLPLLRGTVNCWGGADGDGGGAVMDSDTEDVATLADIEGVDGDDCKMGAGRGTEQFMIFLAGARDLPAC